MSALDLAFGNDDLLPAKAPEVRYTTLSLSLSRSLSLSLHFLDNLYMYFRSFLICVCVVKPVPYRVLKHIETFYFLLNSYCIFFCLGGKEEYHCGVLEQQRRGQDEASTLPTRHRPHC